MSRRSSELASRADLRCCICPVPPGGADSAYVFSSSAELAEHYELVHECQICEMFCLNETARYEHLNRAHGKQIRLGEYQRVVGSEVVNEPWRLENVPGWEDPVGSLVDMPTTVEPLVAWLNEFCVRLAACELPEFALLNVPEDLAAQCIYVETRFRAVVRAVRTARYTRLKRSSARAGYLAKALALPDAAPGYAEQKLRGVMGPS